MTSAGDDPTPTLQEARRDVLERAGGIYDVGAAAVRAVDRYLPRTGADGKGADRRKGY